MRSWLLVVRQYPIYKKSFCLVDFNSLTLIRQGLCSVSQFVNFFFPTKFGGKWDHYFFHFFSFTFFLLSQIATMYMLGCVILFPWISKALFIFLQSFSFVPLWFICKCTDSFCCLISALRPCREFFILFIIFFNSRLSTCAFLSFLFPFFESLSLYFPLILWTQFLLSP